jgi:hypothetical protein
MGELVFDRRLVIEAVSRLEVTKPRVNATSITHPLAFRLPRLSRQLPELRSNPIQPPSSKTAGLPLKFDPQVAKLIVLRSQLLLAGLHWGRLHGKPHKRLWVKAEAGSGYFGKSAQRLVLNLLIPHLRNRLTNEF